MCVTRDWQGSGFAVCAHVPRLRVGLTQDTGVQSRTPGFPHPPSVNSNFQSMKLTTYSAAADTELCAPRVKGSEPERGGNRDSVTESRNGVPSRKRQKKMQSIVEHRQ